MPARLWASAASLRLTVVLLAYAMFLIFVGTLAQARVGVWEAVDTYFRAPVAMLDPGLFVPGSSGADWRLRLPGGATVGLLLLINLLAAHTARFRLTRRRAGIIVLHLGLIVLLAGEFLTAILADEGLMSIDVGDTAGFVEDIRSTELAVTGPRGTVTLSDDALVTGARTGRAVADPRLPFEVEVLGWMLSATVVPGGAPGPADRGLGLRAAAEPRPAQRGVDGAGADTPAAYLRLTADGVTLGTWMFSADLVNPQPIRVGDTEYAVSLRFRRTEKPYRLTLLEFRHDTFVGTRIPRNFSSRVRLVDAERGVDREVVIWMNNPLRYRGDTLYQASYKPDNSGTVLQVVRNPGATLPYIACVLVAAGLLWHFGLGMTAFLCRRATRRAAARADRPATGPGRRALPWVVGLAGVLIALAGLARPQPPDAAGLDTFASLPVSAGGRVKPLDTAARHALMVAGGRQSIEDGDGEVSAIGFLLGLMSRPDEVADLPVIRVDHPGVLDLLGLTPEDAGRLSLNAIEPHWSKVAEQAERALQTEAKRRDPFERAVGRLYIAVDTLLAHARMRDPYLIPPLGPEGQWQSFDEAFSASLHASNNQQDPDAAPVHPAVAHWVAIMSASSAGDTDAMHRAVDAYDALLGRNMPGLMAQANLEVLFNRARLFVGATAVYLLAGLVLLGSMMLRLRPEGKGRAARLGEVVRVCGVSLAAAALLVHTAAILLRMHLEGRPPVTNLYSSAVFVGWAAALFGLLLERLHPIGVGALAASVVGVATLVVAHNLGAGGDTMQMMQAVLDSNFWLATHVITITLGYSATFLAGTLGAGFIVMGVFTRRLTPELAKALTTMVYATVCFALLLSFVGTVLGGIWADQSWGRFWGWDPKENGAVLVVLINAIILHARWGGMVRARGIMVLAVGGNIITAWSWFGTNMLGVGLHSYGFVDSAVFWMLAFVVAQLAMMGLGMLPRSVWRSGGLPSERRGDSIA